MELTADQVDQIRSALAEGRRRISLTPTDVQRHLWRQEAATEDVYRDDTVARVGRIRAAAAIERLAATLNLRLMHEIPRNSGA